MVSDVYVSLSKFQIFDFRERDMRPSSWQRCPHKYRKQRATGSYTKSTDVKGMKEKVITGGAGACRSTRRRASMLAAFPHPSPLQLHL